MPREKSPGSPTTRRYTPSEKEDAVLRARQRRKELGSDHGTVQRVAKQLGCGPESVRKWVADAGERDGFAGPDAQRVRELEQRARQLEQENKELRRTNAILKSASAFFAAELDRPSK